MLKLRTKPVADAPVEVAPVGSGNLWRFLSFARPYRWWIVLVILLGCTRYALQFATPWGVGVLLDNALSGSGRLGHAGAGARLTEVRQISIALVAALLFRCVAQYFETMLTSRLGNRLVFDLRRRVYCHIHRLSQSFFDSRQVGSIGSRILNDISVAQNLIGSGVVSVVIDAIALVFTLAVLFRLEWRLTLVASAIMPGYVVALRCLNPRIRALSQEIQDRFSEISGTVYESLAGIQVVQAFTQERASERQFVHETRGHFERLMSRTRLNARLSFMTTFLTGLGTILLLWWGGRLVIAGALTAGMLVQFYSYVSYLYGPLSRFADLNQVYQNSMGAVDRVFEVLDTRSEVEDPRTERSGPALTGHVRFERVSFGYQADRPVLRDLDLDVAPGQMIAFVGPSGSGKTTVTKLLLRFYDVSEGTIRVDGRDVKELPLRELRRQVGVVLQEPILFTGTVRENIRFGRPAATEEEVIAAAAAANAHDFIRELPDGYDTLVGERGAHLSGGQRQRISIARALLKDPRILILDEATSALDSESERLIQEALERLMEGRTSFVVAHRLSTIVSADRIVVLDRGRIVEQGQHEELLLRQGLYAELCAKQFIGAANEPEDVEEIRVEDAMQRDLTSVPEDLPVTELFTLMQLTHQHGFPVLRRDGGLLGMVTLSDVEDHVLEHDPELTVGRICSRDPIVCHPEQSLADALKELGTRDVGGLPVVSRSEPRRLVGMLRRADVVMACSRATWNRSPGAAAEMLDTSDPDGLRFFRICVSAGAPSAGRAVRDLDLPGDCVLVSVRRGSETEVPRGHTVLQEGDCIFALGKPGCEAALRRGLSESVRPCRALRQPGDVAEFWT